MPALTPAPPAPQRGDRATFSGRVDDFLRWEATLPDQLNAFGSELNQYLVGNPYTFSYVFNSATADADPGPGVIRLNNTAQSSATTLRIDAVAGGGANLNVLFDALLSATSSVKGSLRLMAKKDPTRWLLFDYTTINTGTGYRNFTITLRASTAESPLVSGETVLVTFQRNGDSGTVPGATELMASVSITTAVTAINLLNVFDADHDFYFVVLDGILCSPVASGVVLRLAVSGSVYQTANYSFVTTNSATAATQENQISMSSSASISDFSGILEFSSVNYTNRNKSVGYRLNIFRNGQSAPFVNSSGSGLLNNPSAIVTGFQISNAGSGSFSGGTVRVYGVRKS